MPVKLISHLRFLNPSLPVASLPSIKCSHSFASTHSISIFSRIFPFKLKTLEFLPRSGSHPSFSRFSTRRALRVGSESKSEFNRDRGHVSSSKSLIEDEAELSNWVDELRTSLGFRGRFTSDDESDSGRGSSGRGSRGRGRDRFSMKKKRTRESFDSVPKRIRGGFRSDDDDVEEDGGRFGSRRRIRGNVSMESGRRGVRERGLGFRIDGKGSRGKSGFIGDEMEEGRFRFSKNNRNGKRGGQENGLGFARDENRLRGRRRFIDDDKESRTFDDDDEEDEEEMERFHSGK